MIKLIEIEIERFLCSCGFKKYCLSLYTNITHCNKTKRGIVLIMIVIIDIAKYNKK